MTYYLLKNKNIMSLKIWFLLLVIIIKNMVKFILIKPNEMYPTFRDIKKRESPRFSSDNLTLLEKKSNYIDMDFFREYVKDIIEIVDISTDNDEWMADIVKMIKLDVQHYGDLVDCYEGKDSIFQLWGCFPNQDDNLDEAHRNILGSFLTMEKKLMFGRVVLFKTSLPSTNFDATIVDTTIDDLAGLVMNNFYHSCVKLNVDNSIEQLFFDNEKYFVDEKFKFNRKSTHHILRDEKFGQIENSLLKFNLNFIYNSNDDSLPLNEPMTRLLKRIVKGDGLLVSPFQENAFFDLSKEDVINMLKVEKHLNIEDDDTKEEKNERGVRLVKNKYRILNNKLKKI